MAYLTESYASWDWLAIRNGFSKSCICLCLRLDHRWQTFRNASSSLAQSATLERKWRGQWKQAGFGTYCCGVNYYLESLGLGFWVILWVVQSRHNPLAGLNPELPKPFYRKIFGST